MFGKSSESDKKYFGKSLKILGNSEFYYNVRESIYYLMLMNSSKKKLLHSNWLSQVFYVFDYLTINHTDACSFCNFMIC